MEKSTHISQLDKLTMQYVSQRLRANLSQLAQELNLKIEIGTCSFNTHNCRVHLNLAVLDSKGKPINEEVEAFRRYAPLLGFEEADLNKEFNLNGKPYSIVGFISKNQKTPVLVKSKDGKNHKFSCQKVLEALGRKVPDWI